jgi:hypothetical protein
MQSCPYTSYPCVDLYLGLLSVLLLSSAAQKFSWRPSLGVLYVPLYLLLRQVNTEIMAIHWQAF